MKVERLMKTDVAACRSDDTGNCAARIMWERDCGFVPVVDELSRVIGVVTDRDLCMAAYTQGKPLQGIPLHSVMSKEVFSCQPDDDLSKAETGMRRHQVRRLPVTDAEGKLKGILSLSDITRRGGERSQDAAWKSGSELLGSRSDPGGHQYSPQAAASESALGTAIGEVRAIAKQAHRSIA